MAWRAVPEGLHTKPDQQKKLKATYFTAEPKEAGGEWQVDRTEQGGGRK